MKTLDPIKNFSEVEVSTGYDASATTIVLASGERAKLPDVNTEGESNGTWYNATDYPAIIDDPNREIIRRIDDDGTNGIVITRAQESTSATTKNTATRTYKIAFGVTEKTHNNNDDAISINPLTAITSLVDAFEFKWWSTSASTLRKMTWESFKSILHGIFANKDLWETYSGTMPVFVSTTDGVDTLTLTDADDFLSKSGKVELTSDTGTHMYYVSQADSSGFKLNGETSPSGTITAMRYSYADAPFGFKKGQDWYTMSAFLNAAQSTGTGTTQVPLDSEEFDDNNNFSTSTGEWTCPITAKYTVSANARVVDTNAGLKRCLVQVRDGTTSLLKGTQSLKSAGNRTDEFSAGITDAYIVRGTVCGLYSVIEVSNATTGLSFTGSANTGENKLTIKFTGI